MKQKRYIVIRPLCSGNVKMSCGDEQWEEPRFSATVWDTKACCSVGTVGNACLLCLPGRSVDAPKATDAEIIAALVGDEHIYDTDADGEQCKKLLAEYSQ